MKSHEWFYVITWIRGEDGGTGHSHRAGTITFSEDATAWDRFVQIQRHIQVPDDAVFTSYHCERNR